jgi:hypothetical protein
LVEYSGEEITAKWGSTTITGLTTFAYKAGTTITPLYQGGSRNVQKLKVKEHKPVTGSFTRRFDIYSSDWIAKMDSGETAQAGVDIVVQHGALDKFTLKTALITDYDYKYSVPGGMAEEIITFTAVEKQESAS